MKEGFVKLKFNDKEEKENLIKKLTEWLGEQGYKILSMKNVETVNNDFILKIIYY